MRFFLPFFCAAALLAPLSGRADDGRFQDYAVGARAMGLGGAYAALSDDATGVFYNPAGIVDVRRPRLSIATSLYGLELNGATPVESALVRLERGVHATDLIVVPSTTGAAFGLGERLPGGAYRHAFAFSTMVPQYTSRFLETAPVSDLDTVFRSALVDRTLHAGAAYATRPGPWARLGLALHYVLRTIDAEESVFSGFDGGGDVLSESTRLRSATSSVRAAFGLKVWTGPRLSIGVAATTPSLSVWQSTSFDSTRLAIADGRADEPPERTRIAVDGPAWQAQLPGTLRIGAAWQEPGDLTLSLDVVGSLPSSYDLLPPSVLADHDVIAERVALPLSVRRGALVNAMAGFEKRVVDEVSVSLGAFTNFSAAEPLVTDAQGFLRPGSPRLSNVHMVGGSFALGFWGAHNVARVGVTGSTGWGRVVVPSTPAERFEDGRPPLRAVSAVQSYVYVFWSSTFRFGPAPGEDDGGVRDFSL